MQVTISPTVPWYNDKIDKAKRGKRRLEAQWRKSKLEVHKQMFKDDRYKLRHITKEVKVSCYQTAIQDCNADQKKLFSMVNNLLHQKQPSRLPSRDSSSDLAQSFASYLVTKIERIDNTEIAGVDVYSDQTHCRVWRMNFQSTSEKEVEKYTDL